MIAAGTFYATIEANGRFRLRLLLSQAQNNAEVLTSLLAEVNSLQTDDPRRREAARIMVELWTESHQLDDLIRSQQTRMLAISSAMGKGDETLRRQDPPTQESQGASRDR